MFLEKLNKISSYLPKQDRSDFALYIYLYSKNIEKSYGHYDWNHPDFVAFCKTEKITAKGTKSKKGQSNHFWFSTSADNKTKINDVAHHFLRHIRNAFAHGMIEAKYEGRKKHKFFVLRDKDKNGNDSMKGVVRSDLLWSMIDLLYKSYK